MTRAAETYRAARKRLARKQKYIWSKLPVAMNSDTKSKKYSGRFVIVPSQTATK